VQFRYKDYRDDSQQKTMTLSADEFIRRFLFHVLPEGLHRIGYYGFLGPILALLWEHRAQHPPLAQAREDKMIGLRAGTVCLASS
jgi:hypothetical protein